MFILRNEKMKTLIALILTLTVMSISGCGNKVGSDISKGDGFKITPPASSTRINIPTFRTSIKRGETRDVTVTVDRNENFYQDVYLEVKVPACISIHPTTAVIKAADKPDVKLRIRVHRDAPIGKYEIFILGTPRTEDTPLAEIILDVVAF